MRHKIWILRMDFQVYLCIAVIMLTFCVSERGVAQEMDFGDAPAPYPTFSDANGARHAHDADVFLGLKLARKRYSIIWLYITDGTFLSCP